MRTFPARALSLLTVALLVLGSAALTGAAEPKTAEIVEKSASTPPEDPNIVAQINEYDITIDDVEKRLMDEIRPYDDLDIEKVRKATALTVAETLIAEKAMTIDARKKGFLGDEMIKKSLNDFYSRRVAGLLIQSYVEGKVTVTDAEVEAAMKANPKLDKVAAKVTMESAKARTILDEKYRQVHASMNVRKVTENFQKAADIHKRLLLQPKIKRQMQFIQSKQVQDETTQQERDMPLAVFAKGAFTLNDFFNALSNIAPPRRPADLNTAAGVQKFVDSGLKLPLFVAEAERLGFNKDEKLLAMMKQQEDMRLLSKAKLDLFDTIAEPNEARSIAYFNENKNEFVSGEKIKIDQIWCENRDDALKIKAQLAEGKDFEALKQQHSLNKDSKPYDTYRSSEGLFWEEIAAGEPNDVVGPIKGFRQDSVKWRLVKVFEKSPGTPADITDENVKNRAKWKLAGKLRAAAMEKRLAELLDQYPHKIYDNRVKAIDPLNIK